MSPDVSTIFFRLLVFLQNRAVLSPQYTQSILVVGVFELLVECCRIGLYVLFETTQAPDSVCDILPVTLVIFHETDVV